MTPRSKPAPSSDDAFSHMVHDLTCNAALNGSQAALSDAKEFARGCFAHIQVTEGHDGLVAFLQQEIAASTDRALVDKLILRGRP